MSLDCGRTPENLEETHSSTRRTCKLCTENPQFSDRFKPMTFYIRGVKLSFIPGHISIKAALKWPLVTVDYMQCPTCSYRQSRQVPGAALWQGQKNVGQTIAEDRVTAAGKL